MAAIGIALLVCSSSSAVAGWYAYQNNYINISSNSLTISYYTPGSNTMPVSNLAPAGSNLAPAMQLTDQYTGASMLAPMTNDTPTPMMRSDIGTSIMPSDSTPVGINTGRPITVTLSC
jgi:hypothetical protein